MRDDIENWEYYFNSEFTLDIDDNILTYENGESILIPADYWIYNFSKIITLLYDRAKTFVLTAFIENHFVKLYKKEGERARLEVTGSKVAKNPIDLLKRLLEEKNKLLETEYRNEKNFEKLATTLQSVDSHLETSVPQSEFEEMKFNLNELREDQITSIYQLDKIQQQQQEKFEELSNHQIELMKTMGKYYEAEKSRDGLIEKLIETQNKLIESQNNIFLGIQLLQEKMQDNLEILQNKTNEIENRLVSETHLLKYKLERMTWTNKIKRFFGYIKRKLLFEKRK